MRRKLTIMTVLSIIFLSINSAYSGPYWAKSYGGEGSDMAWSVLQTSDSGYVLTGYTTSDTIGDMDAFVLKLDMNGDVEWKKNYGAIGVTWALSIRQTVEGGYILVGSTTSFGAGGLDICVLKLTESGEIEWKNAYGGSGDEYGYSVDDTNDAGFIVAGYTNSFGAGSHDFWVLKLDGIGNVEWQKTYGGSLLDQARHIEQTSDGGYIVAGYTESYGVCLDMWVLKLDNSGNIQWQKAFGGDAKEKVRQVHQTSDGGYIVAGGTYSYGNAFVNMCVLKLDQNGNIEWQKVSGGDDWEKCRSIQQTSDAGYIMAGYTGTGLPGSDDDMAVLKLDESGNVQWKRTYGGDSSETALSIFQTIDEGYVVAGTTDSFGVGSEDVLVLKIDSRGFISDCNMTATINPNVMDIEIGIVDTTAVARISEGIVGVVGDILPQSPVFEVEEICFNGISEVWGYVYINGIVLKKGNVILLQPGEANQAIRVNQGYYGFENVVYDKPIGIRINMRNGISEVWGDVYINGIVLNKGNVILLQPGEANQAIKVNQGYYGFTNVVYDKPVEIRINVRNGTQ